MVKPFKLTAVAATAAMLIAGATPAMARPGPWGGHGGGYGQGYGGGYGHGGRGWRRGGGGVSFGDVLLGAVIVGGVAAVANGVANGPRAQDRRDDDGGYDDGRDGEVYGRGQIDGDPRYGAGYQGDRRGAGGPQEEAAVDRCADAARSEAGSGSRIDGIRHVGRDGEGWRVEGDVTEGRGYGQSFVCGVRADRVDFVQLSDRIAAR